MKIVNNKKTPRCKICRREITEDRKVKWSSKTYLHISCAYDYTLREFKKWRKIKNHLSRYNLDIVIKRLK